MNDHLVFEFPAACQTQWECLAFLLIDLAINGMRVVQLEEGGEYIPSVRISVRKIESGLTLFASVALTLDGTDLITNPIHSSVASE